MAGDLHVRNLDDELTSRLKRRAARHGRSIEAEHREILRLALAGESEASWGDLAAQLRELTRRPHSHSFGSTGAGRTRRALIGKADVSPCSGDRLTISR
jgi:antitoxin FitA